MDFLAEIRTHYNQFTRAEKRVADYVLGHPEEILFLSITEFSDLCGVGETTVFRFCRTMGLGGYQEFKMRLSLSVHWKEGEGSALTSDITPEDGVGVTVQKVLAAAQRALSETAALLDTEQLEQAVELMLGARRIAFFGVGASLTSAMQAANKFLRIEPKVICVSDAHMQAMVAATMGPEDVAVVFSYSGSTKDSNAVARLASETGAKVIAITRFRKSPLLEYANLRLLCGAKEGPLQGGSSGADIAQSFLMDLLYTEYFRRNYEQCSIRNAQTSASITGKLL